jgi:predicted nucleic acid-binding protein
MKIVIDTNVVFSALLNANNSHVDIIISSPQERFQFYTSDYMLVELNNHRESLKKASKLGDDKIDTAKYGLFKHIHFVTLSMIPEDYWKEAERLVANIDMDDIAFVTLSLYLHAYLWKGDKVLSNGLRKEGYDKLITTAELKQQLYADSGSSRL